MVTAQSEHSRPAKLERRVPTVKAVHILKLRDQIGVTRAAKELGTSTTTVHRARREGVVSEIWENRAKQVLENLQAGVSTSAPAPAPRAPRAAASRRSDGTAPKELAVLRIDPDKREMLEQFVRAIGGEFITA
jgi:uncharacterized protein (DUF4415 family)